MIGNAQGHVRTGNGFLLNDSSLFCSPHPIITIVINIVIDRTSVQAPSQVIVVGITEDKYKRVVALKFPDQGQEELPGEEPVMKELSGRAADSLLPNLFTYPPGLPINKATSIFLVKSAEIDGV